MNFPAQRPRRCVTCPPAHLESLEARTLLGASPFPDLSLLDDPADPVARIHTQYGDIDLELLAGDVPQTVANFIALLDSPSGFQQTFFNRVDPAHTLEGGTYAWLGDMSDAGHAAQYVGAPGETGRANLARTVSTWARHTPGPPFSQFTGSGYSINLQDNPPPASDGDWVVFAKVLGDDSWNVVQTIAGLSLTDFMNTQPMRTPFASDLSSVPVTRAWTTGDPITPDLLVQAWDTSLIKAPGAPDYYRHTIYSAEGFTGSTINEYVPIENPNDTPIFYEVRARYEHLEGDPLTLRDDLVERGSIAAHSRGGITVSTIANWANTSVLAGKPYALEVRSTLPVAAQLSHYDFGGATGEGFTDRLDTQWFLGDGYGVNRQDFLVFYNPNDQTSQLEVIFRDEEGNETRHLTLLVERYRRAGVDLLAIRVRGPATVTSSLPILAASSRYTTYTADAFSAIGVSGPPSEVGVTPIAFERGLGLNPYPITFHAYNPSSSEAVVNVDLFEAGNPVPFLSIPAISLLPGQYRFFVFPSTFDAQHSPPLALVYHSTAPVYASAIDARIEDTYSSTLAISAATDVHFAEGFLDPARLAPGVLEEEFSVFNPNSSIFNAPDRDAHITFTFRFADGGTLAINQTVQHGTLFRLAAADTPQLLDYITSHHSFFFSVEVSGDIPIVAQMLHCDATLGDPNRAAGGFITDGTIFGPVTRLDQLGGG